MMIENWISSLAALAPALLLAVGLGCSSNDIDTSNTEQATRVRNGPSNWDDLTARPLVSARGAAGPLFEELSSRTTGVDFVNVLHPENNVPYIYMV